MTPRPVLSLFALGILAGHVVAQDRHNVPATRDQLRQRSADVAQALSWPKADESATEEFRIIAGSGDGFPGMAFRSRRKDSSATGSAGFWWVRGQFADAIRRTMSDNRDQACKRFTRSGGVEACELTPQQLPDWNSIWSLKATNDMRTLVLKSSKRAGASEPDSVVAAIQWRQGSQTGELMLSTDTTATTVETRKAFRCLFQALVPQPAEDEPEDDSPC
jgi:hypothetical protein